MVFWLKVVIKLKQTWVSDLRDQRSVLTYQKAWCKRRFRCTSHHLIPLQNGMFIDERRTFSSSQTPLKVGQHRFLLPLCLPDDTEGGCELCLQRVLTLRHQECPWMSKELRIWKLFSSLRRIWCDICFVQSSHLHSHPFHIMQCDLK